MRLLPQHRGFVDEEGKFSPQGPDYLGQTRRLRTSDGVYFTKFGARKLALYVEREIERMVGNKGVPVALPVPVGPGPHAPNAKAGEAAQSFHSRRRALRPKN